MYDKYKSLKGCSMVVVASGRDTGIGPTALVLLCDLAQELCGHWPLPHTSVSTCREWDEGVSTGWWETVLSNVCHTGNLSLSYRRS